MSYQRCQSRFPVGRVARTLTIASVCAALCVTQGCGMFSGGVANRYTSSQALGENSVRAGTIVSIREVALKNEQTGLGALGGGVMGAVGGSMLGGGRGSVAFGALGALLGAAAGAGAEHGLGAATGIEITIRLDSGELTSITQNTKGEIFAPGERVRILRADDGVARVTH